MTRFRAAKDVAALLEGADCLLVIGPEARLRAPVGTGAKRSRAAHIGVDLPGRLGALVQELARSEAAGAMGREATTLTGGEPKRLALALLPAAGSRYNAPARAESIRRIVAASRSVLTSTRLAVLLLLDEREHMLAAVNAVGRALPLYQRGKARPGPRTLSLLALDGAGAPLPFSSTIRRTVEAARAAARLVDTAPSDLGPVAFQREAWDLVAGAARVTRRAISGKLLVSGHFGGVVGVGKCALEGPRVLVLEYRPARRAARHVALVGKGVTYDTGGLSLKTRGAMVGMKADMGGAAAVLGAFNVLARTGCPHRLSAVLCVAENAIGPEATKPDDILEMHSGLTVEVNNTDAEGRLLLADGVSYAARKLGADTILDAATLTGAQAVATGRLHAAVVSNDEELERTLIDAGRASGDLVHPLPFAPELYRSEFTSAVADMRNSVANRSNAQVSCAAEFVHWHLDGTEVRWAHVDLAGPAFNGKRATGYGVALLAETVRRL